MKTVNIYFILAFFGIAISSCEKEEVYCCDKAINSWIKENIDDVRSMTRSAWIELPEELKGPVFGAFSSEQKSIFWNERMKEILTLEWNKEEKDHLKKLYNAILTRKYWFDDAKNKTESIEDEISLFAFKWIDYAKEELQWDEKLIFAIVGSGNRIVSKTGELYVVDKQNQHPRLKSGNERACNCNQKYDFCSYPEPDCLNHECEERPYCGWLLLSKCNGLCGIK